MVSYVCACMSVCYIRFEDSDDADAHNTIGRQHSDYSASFAIIPVSYFTTSYHITSYHIISYHFTSHHIISDHITSHHITAHHITSSHIISHHIISHHIISHRIAPHHATSYHITSYHMWHCVQFMMAFIGFTISLRTVPDWIAWGQWYVHEHQIGHCGARVNCV